MPVTVSHPLAEMFTAGRDIDIADEYLRAR